MVHKSELRRNATVAFALLAFTAGAARAEHLDWRSGGLTLSLGASAGFGFFAVPNAGFGAGSYDIRAVRDHVEGLRTDTGAPVRAPAWFEAFLKPELRMRYDLRGGGALFAGVSAIYAQTLGDGDAFLTSLTRGNPGSLDLEEAYVGFRTAGEALVLQLGRQNFTIDDGFIVQFPAYNIGRAADFYLTPRMAFDGWGTIRINTDPVRADIFALGTPVDNSRAYGNAFFAVDQPDTNFVGFDVEWFQNAPAAGANGALNYLDRAKYLSFTYFNIYDADRNPVLYGDIAPYWSRRHGLHVFSLSAGGNLLPIRALGLKDDATLYAQYVREINTTRGSEVDANAYYIESNYRFSKLRWTPQVYYRYSHFSGQPGPPGDRAATKRGYDFLFTGGGARDFFGNYGLGEVVGLYVNANTNLNVHQVSLKLTAPFHLFKAQDALSFELLGYAFSLDHPEAAGATVHAFAKEIDLAVQYALDEKTFGAFAAGVAFPERGALEATAAASAGFSNVGRIGADTYVLEFYVFHNF